MPLNLFVWVKFATLTGYNQSNNKLVNLTWVK